MQRCLMMLGFLLTVAPWAAAQDPTKVDPNHYAVIFENEQVRVLRITYGPGEKSVMHYHSAGVIVVLTDTNVQLTLPDGTTATGEMKAGEVAWTPGGSHQPKSLGDERFEVIQIELKGGKGETSSKAEEESLPAHDDMAAGLKDALRVGAETVIDQLGQLDGFNADPEIHIPLPESLGKVASKLEKLGMSAAMKDLETRLNRAAEVAIPKARDLFGNAITEMTLEDVKDIFTGEDDAATRYLQDKMSEPLSAEMRPVVDESLSEVGAVQAFDKVMGRYKSIPFVSNVDTDLTGYVVEQGMAGVFLYLAREEAAIRRNPVKRTTDLLKRVFGAF